MASTARHASSMIGSSTSHTDNHIPRLDKLPEELVSHISCKLGPDDIFAFRLTCKSLQAKSFHEFATEYFSEKGFHFTTDSLKVLVGIAENSELAPYLKKVYILTSFFHEKAFKFPTCKPKVRQSEAYRFYIKDQEQLKESKNDRKMMAEAFGKLPRLRVLCMVDDILPSTVDMRGYSKTSRICNTTPMMAACPAGTDDEYRSWRTHVWNTVLMGLVKSGDTSVREFGVNLTSGQSNMLSASEITFSGKLLPQMTKGFSHVTKLDLQLRMTDMPKHTSHADVMEKQHA